MLGALGCLTPELLAKYQGINFPEPVWFRTGAQILGSGSIDYLGQPGIIHAQSIVFTLATQVRFMKRLSCKCFKTRQLRFEMQAIYVVILERRQNDSSIPAAVCDNSAQTLFTYSGTLGLQQL